MSLIKNFTAGWIEGAIKGAPMPELARLYGLSATNARPYRDDRYVVVYSFEDKRPRAVIPMTLLKEGEGLSCKAKESFWAGLIEDYGVKPREGFEAKDEVEKPNTPLGGNEYKEGKVWVQKSTKTKFRRKLIWSVIAGEWTYIKAGTESTQIVSSNSLEVIFKEEDLT